MDDQYRPIPAGQHSHTVLITNLANHVQPIIRYELGDSVTVDPDPCPCGSPLPTVRVIGRTDEILRFPTEDHRSIQILPLALWSVIKETPGVSRFQAIQTAPTKLMVRLEARMPGEIEPVWQSLKQRVQNYLGVKAWRI